MAASSSTSSPAASSASEKRPRLTHQRPNYFLAIRITSPVIHRWVNDIQAVICGRDARLEEWRICPDHITLCTMRLENDDDISKATDTFESLREEISSLLSPATKLRFQSLGQFPNQNRILFAAPEPSPALMELERLLKTRLGEAGVNLAGTRDRFNPHMTIFKVRYMEETPRDRPTVHLRLYEDFANSIIGVQQIDAIHLCSMVDPTQDDGFYHCLASMDVHPKQ